MDGFAALCQRQGNPQTAPALHTQPCSLHHHQSIHPPGASWQAVVQSFVSLRLLFCLIES